MTGYVLWEAQPMSFSLAVKVRNGGERKIDQEILVKTEAAIRAMVSSSEEMIRRWTRDSAGDNKMIGSLCFSASVLSGFLCM